MTRSTITLILLPLLVACKDGVGPAPTMADVAGSYVATSLVTTTSGTSTDQLAAGSEITLVLAADGTTTGNMFVPGGDEDGSDYDVDLTGTWALDGSTVTFDHPADTFIRDMDFHYAGGALTGDRTFSDTRVEITLTRQ